MASVTLSTLRTRARARADMEGATSTSFVSDSQLNQFINDSVKELHDLLIQKFGSDYYLTSGTLTFSSGVAAVPSGFYKLAGIDYNIAGRTVSLDRFNFAERNAYKNSALFTNWDKPVYRLEGTNVRLLPQVADGTTATIWYHPAASELSGDSDSVNYPSGWEEYIVVDAAIKMRVKEESEIQELLIAKQEQRQRIEEAASNRDAGDPDRIADLGLADIWELY